VIDPAVAGALDRIASRANDVRGAYRAGFEPAASDVAAPARVVRNEDPLSVSLPEGAFVASPGPSGELQYGRDGTLRIADGALAGPDGRPVLGFALGSRRSLAALRFDPYDAATGRIANPRIDADGTVSYDRASVDPRTGTRRSERVAVGRIALARFPAGTQPERIDGVHVRPPSGVGARFGVPGEGGFAPLTTHARDLGRVDVLAGLERMKEAYVAFEALRAARHGRDGTAKIALDLVK